MKLLRRVAEQQRQTLTFWLDGRALSAYVGDTVLTAVLTQAAQLRRSEFSGMPRAGFCLIGSCQDCWMRLEDGGPLRACSTTISEGMRLCSGSPAAALDQDGKHNPHNPHDQDGQDGQA